MICLVLNSGSWNYPVRANSRFERKEQEQTAMALGRAAKDVDSFGKEDRALPRRAGQGWDFSFSYASVSNNNLHC